MLVMFVMFLQNPRPGMMLVMVWVNKIWGGGFSLFSIGCFQPLLLNARRAHVRGSELLYFAGKTMKLCVKEQRSATIALGPSRWCTCVVSAWLTFDLVSWCELASAFPS